MLRHIEKAVIAAILGFIPAGDIFYVDSGHAATANVAKAKRGYVGHGTTPDKPFATIHYASTQCTASNGDVIIVAAGHAEAVTAAAGIALAKAGVTIIGLGNGDNRPTVTLGTATTADIDIDAKNITIKNIRFVSDIDDLAVMFDVNESYFTLEDCFLHGPTAKECLNFVNLATTKDTFAFRRTRFLQEADPTGTDGAAATGAIYVVDSENILVEECTFDGFFETACLHNKTTALKYLTWRRNSVNQQLTITGRRILLVASTVGCSIGVDNDFVPGLGYKMQKTEDGNTATADDLFTVAGKVLVTDLSGEVTNALGATAKFSDYKYNISGGADLCAAGDISSAAIGHIIRLNSDTGDTILASSTQAVAAVKTSDTNGKGMANRILGLDGLATLTLQGTRTAGDSGDAIIHSLWYIPLEPGAHVVAAA